MCSYDGWHLPTAALKRPAGPNFHLASASVVHTASIVGATQCLGLDSNLTPNLFMRFDIS